MTTIIVTHEDNEIDEFAFDAEDRVITIGRRSTNDVCIPNLSVSGMHARITIDGNGVSIEDNNSTNGTYVNGRLISRQLLNESDEIVIGKTRVVVNTTTNQTQHSFDEPPTLQARNDDLIADADYDDADDSYVGEPSPARTQQQFDDRPMSLSEKAKLALGREGGRDPGRDNIGTTAVAGAAVAASAATSSAAAAASRAFASEGDTAVAEAPAPASTGSATAQSTAAAEAHPLDGLDDAQVVSDTSVAGNTGPAEHNLVAAEQNPAAPVMKSASAVIEIQNGAKSGQVLPIDKPVTTLGRPGIQIAAIMRKPDGYFLMHIESDDSVDMPTLNRDTIGDDPVMLNSGDRLNVAGIDVEFMLS